MTELKQQENTSTPAVHKAGFVNIVGNPNVGKSTLMNDLVGERVSIITSKAQTTRHRIMGIVNTPEYQIVFSDTPGVLQPKYKLQESMLNFSEGALTDADVLLYVTDVVEDPTKNADYLAKVAKEKVPVLLVINKIDLLKGNGELEKIVERWKNARRTDIIVDYAGEQFIVEMKIWHGNEYKERGEQQLADYLDAGTAHTAHHHNRCMAECVS